jgi:hypothetical protein
MQPSDIQDKGQKLAEALAAEIAAKNNVDGVTAQLAEAQKVLTTATTTRNTAQKDLTDLLKG